MNKHSKDYFSYIIPALIYELILVTSLTILVVISTSNDALIKTLEYLNSAVSFWSFIFPVAIGAFILVMKDRILLQKSDKDKISELGGDLFESLIGTFRLIVVTLFAFVIAYCLEYGWSNESGFIVSFALFAYFENGCFIAFKRYKTRSK
ncbi:hypothetical protein [Acinetobacter oleivorans]|uniref:hypothetical protein n=1 Tax=Acinetobacter oleivorans TaxID=1148157 RepID=UPI003A86F4C6